MPTLPQTLVLRAYDAQDDAACRELEVRASQFQGLGGYIKAAIYHHGSFDAKPRQYLDHILLVVVDSQNHVVCGVVAVAIKCAYVHGKARTCGYVFDLRVDERYQRQGIGAALTTEAEAQCKVRGVELLYLSMNKDNRKARALYEQQSWELASARTLVFRPTLFLPTAPRGAAAAAAAGGGVKQLEPARALELTSRYYSERALGLTSKEMAHLFRSPMMLATYLASDGNGSEAALSLWHGSALTAFYPVTLLLPVTLWVRLGPWLAAAALGATLLTCRALFRAAPGPWPLAPGPVSTALLGLTVGTAAAGLLTFGRWVSSRAAFRARSFAPVVVGPQGPALLSVLHAHLLSEARRRGFAFVVVNEACGSVYADVLTKKRKQRSPTVFWQKTLTPCLGPGLSALPTDMFFDPRDL